MAKKKRQKNGRRRQGGKGKPFTKESPRPGPGRPPLTPEEKEVKDLAKQKSLVCIDRLDELASGSGMTAVRANEILLERAWGKTRQPIDLPPGTGGLVIMLPPENKDG